MSHIAELIAADQWSCAQLETPLGVEIVRFRTPVLANAQARTHPDCLRVVWPYAPDGIGALPDDHISDAQMQFEDRLIAAWETDHLAVLTAVLTFDGARQWAFYTNDAPRCACSPNNKPYRRRQE